MKEKLQVITLKVNASAYGTDPVPTELANVLLAYNFEVDPLEMELDSRSEVSNTFGDDDKIIGAKWSSVSFDFMLRGGGAPLGGAGTVPNHDPVYQACAFARTLSAGVSTTYSQIDTGELDAALYYFNNGAHHKVLGLKGTLEWNYTSKRAGKCSFKGMGLHAVMTDATMPTPTIPVPPRPVAVNKVNSVLTIDSYAVRMSSLVLTQGNDQQYRNLTGVEDVVLADRKSSGKVVFELPAVGTKDFIGAAGLCTLGTPVALSFVHGVTAGNIITHNLPAVQLLAPKLRRESGIRMLECDIHPLRNAHSILYT